MPHTSQLRDMTDEEMYFDWYLAELKEAGIVRDYYYQPGTYTIASAITYTSYKKHKTKHPTPQLHTLLPAYTYTPDFSVYWEPSAYDAFVKILSDTHTDPRIFNNSLPFYGQIFRVETERMYRVDVVSFIDTKGAVSVRLVHQDGLTKFPYKQYMMWTQFGIYINKTVVPTIFKSTFTPQRYLRTDVKQSERKLHYTPRTLSEYLQTKTPSYEKEELIRAGILPARENQTGTSEPTATP